MHRFILPLFVLCAATLACQPDYRQFNGDLGEPCRSNSECESGLVCLAFTCVDPESTTTTQTGTPTPYDAGEPDTDTGRDSGPLPDATDTSPPPPDVGPDVPRDTSPDVDTGGVCIPGEQSCRDERTLQRCRNDGSGFVSRTCGEDQICEVDRCVRASQVCIPGELRCSGNDIRICNPQGSSFETIEECAFNEVCINAQCEEIDEDLPNISLFDATLDRSNAQPGDQITLFLSIANTGAVDTGNFTCSAWLSTDNTLDVNRDISLEFFGEVPDLPAFSEFPGEVPLFIPDVPEGRYNVLLECDVLEPRITELSEDDNLVVATPSLLVQGDNPECNEDPFEFGEPNILSSGEYFLSLCDAEDSFLFNLSEPGDVTFSIQTLNGRPLGILIFDLQFGEPILDIQTDVLNEFRLADLEAGEYFISIQRTPQSSTNTEYLLSLDISTFGNGAPDLVPNFGFIATDLLIPNQSYEVEASVLNIGEGRANSSEFGFFLSRDGVYQPQQDFLIFSSEQGSLRPGEEGFTFEPFFFGGGVPDGFYQLLFVVDPFNRVSERNESNNTILAQSLEVGSGNGGQCTDRYDPNESQDSARGLNAGFYDDLVVCDVNRDFYAFCLGENERLDITLGFIHQRADVDINIYNDFFEQVTGSYGTNNSEFVSVDSTGAQCFFAEVYVCCGGTQNDYEMDVEIRPIPEAERCLTGLEPNDSRQQARPVSDALGREDLALCPENDLDVYTFTIPAGERATIGALSRVEFAEFDLQVSDLNGQFLGSSFGNNPSVTLQARRSASTYFVELRNNNGRRSTQYDLFLNRF